MKHSQFLQHNLLCRAAKQADLGSAVLDDPYKLSVRTHRSTLVKAQSRGQAAGVYRPQRPLPCYPQGQALKTFPQS